MFNNLNLTMHDDFLGTNTNLNTKFDYNSFYRAVVMSTTDPENLGRIRINIPSLHSGVTSLHQYPYAYPGCFTGLGNQVGQFMLPPVGSIVFVTFEFSDEHRPIYFGGIPTVYAKGKYQSYGMRINDGQQKEVTTNDIPTEYTGSQAIIYKSPSGALIMIDDDTDNKKVSIKDSTGQELSMSFDGETKSTKLKVDSNNQIEIQEGKMMFTIDGDEYTFTSSMFEQLVNLINSGGTGGTVIIPEHVTKVEEI